MEAIKIRVIQECCSSVTGDPENNSEPERDHN